MLKKDSLRTQKAKAVFSILGAAVLLFFSVSEARICWEEEKSLETLLQKVADYRHNQNTDAVLELRDYIRKHRQTPDGRRFIEANLLAQLQKGGTPDGQGEILRHLGSLGTAESVPVLQKMLMEKDRSDSVRYALEKIDGPEAEKALLSALDSMAGKARLGIISSLGHRRSPSAVPALARLIEKTDPVTSEAAVNALGNIASADAAKVLLDFLDSVGAQSRAAVADALLRCSDAINESGDAERAMGLYRRIVTSEISAPVSQAAFQGLIRSSGDNAQRMILDALLSSKKGLNSAAVWMLPYTFSAQDLGPVCEILPRLPAQRQVYLIAVLSRYDSDLARVTVMGALAHQNSDVRMAALEGLEKLGNASTVQVLARHAAQSSGSEQARARLSLWNLKDEHVDDAILKNLKRENDPAFATELIRSVGERRITLAKTVLFDSMQDEDSEVRLRSIRALSRLTEPSDLPQLLERLLHIENKAEQNELAEAVAVTAKKITRLNAQSNLVVKKLNEAEQASDRSILLSLLGEIGDESALPAVRRALQDKNELVRHSAARALTEWPTPAARDDVFWLAQNSEDATIQVLAVRAYVRLVEMERFRKPEAAIASLAALLPFVQRPEEKMLVLGTLPRFPCQKALDLAETFLNDPSVDEEAQAAVARLRRMLR